MGKAASFLLFLMLVLACIGAVSATVSARENCIKAITIISPNGEILTKSGKDITSQTKFQDSTGNNIYVKVACDMPDCLYTGQINSDCDPNQQQRCWQSCYTQCKYDRKCYARCKPSFKDCNPKCKPGWNILNMTADADLAPNCYSMMGNLKVTGNLIVDGKVSFTGANVSIGGGGSPVNIDGDTYITNNIFNVNSGNNITMNSQNTASLTSNIVTIEGGTTTNIKIGRAHV